MRRLIGLIAVLVVSLAPSTRAEDATEASPTVVEGQKVMRKAIEWLVTRQEKDGRWDCDKYGGAKNYDVGVTGLAALAMLRGSPSGERGALDRALDYLVSQQSADGMYGDPKRPHEIYNHAVATIAMAEGAARTKSAKHRASLAKALAFSGSARNPYLAWRYGVRPGDNDTSVTSWMMDGYFSAKESGVANTDFEPALRGVEAWLDKVYDPGSGKFGYTARGNGPARGMEVIDKFPAEKSESMTAAGLAMLLQLGGSVDSDQARKATERCLAVLPRWQVDGGWIDMYYWYWGSRAMTRVGGESLLRWRSALVAALRAGQHANGSWHNLGAWGTDGGRVYATAIGALSIAATVDVTWSPRIVRLVLFPPKPLTGDVRARIDALLAGIESDAFDVREKASRALKDAAHADASVTLHVREALAKATELETRRRLERCVAGTEGLGATLRLIEDEKLASSREFLTSLLDDPDEEIRNAARARLEALDGE